MRKKKILDSEDALTRLDSAITRLKAVVCEQIRRYNLQAAEENTQSVRDLEQLKEYVMKQQEIINKYHKADMFLYTHGWRWNE